MVPVWFLILLIAVQVHKYLQQESRDPKTPELVEYAAILKASKDRAWRDVKNDWVSSEGAFEQ